MEKIFIADDEYLIIEGLKRMVAWEENDCKIIGEAENGVTAYEKIKLLNPDIVLTDINMPGMTGLEIIEKANVDNLKCKFIIISCFEDFKYCQKALRLGVCDYLIKPIDFDSIIPKINAIEKKCLSNSTNRNMLLKQYFQDSFDTQIEMKKSNSCNEDILNAKYIYNVCIIVNGKESNSLINKSEFSFFYKMDYQNKFIVIFGEKDETSFREKTIKFDNYLKILFSSCNKKTLWSYGNSCNVNNLGECYRSALKIVENKSFYGQYSSTVNCNSDSTNKYLKTTIKSIAKGAEDCDKKEIDKSINEFFNYIILNHTEKSEVIQYINKLYIMLESVYDNDDKISTNIEMLENTFLSVYDLETMVLNYIKSLIEEVNKKNIQKNDPILKIKNYIKDNYMIDVTLSSISQQFFFNPSYLSRIFKEKTNMTLTEYVNKIRIENAKSLIISRNYSIEDIAIKVGFSSYRYFIKVFKKSTGVTPQEYKKV